MTTPQESNEATAQDAECDGAGSRDGHRDEHVLVAVLLVLDMV